MKTTNPIDAARIELLLSQLQNCTGELNYRFFGG
jgi:hypothetical protein